MKKMKLSILILGAMISLGLFNTYGNTDIPGNTSSKTKMVSFEEVEAGDKLYIKDKKGKTVFTERIKQDGSYAKIFDFTNLPDNEYYFELDKAYEITVLPFKIERDTIALINELRNDIMKPQLITKDEMVILSRDTDNAQSLEIEIYYEGYDLVYNEELYLEGKLKRRYDFSTSSRGEYLFHITYNDRTFSETIEIR